MPFDEFTQRVVVSLGDASVQLRMRRMEGKPSLILGLLKDFATREKIPFKAGEKVDVLVGTGEHAGKLRIRKSKGDGCGVMRGLRLGGFAVDCGFIAALGSEGRTKLRTAARVTADGMVEIDLPSDANWMAATEEAEAAGDGGDNDLTDGTEESEPAPTPRKSVAIANGKQVEREVSLHGITVDLSEDDENISYGSKKQEVTARQAQFLICLLRGMPNTIGRDFLRKKLFGEHGVTAGDVQLDMLARDLTKALPSIELELRTIKGVGFALAKAA